MARIFVTGSGQGLGYLAGTRLREQGHEVVFHARNPTREADLRQTLQGAQIVTGDLETMAGAADLARACNATGRFDAVIHNAGVGDRGTGWLTTDGLPLVFAVNVLAPFLLTALMHRPDRLVYLSSSMHFRPGRLDLAKAWVQDEWRLLLDYGASKFLLTTLAFGVARLWPDVAVNAVDPGWVPTRMGGAQAPGDLALGAATQADLAVDAPMTGAYVHHGKACEPDPATRHPGFQDQLLGLCARITGVTLPAGSAKP